MWAGGGASSIRTSPNLQEEKIGGIIRRGRADGHRYLPMSGQEDSMTKSLFARSTPTPVRMINDPGFRRSGRGMGKTCEGIFPDWTLSVVWHFIFFIVCKHLCLPVCITTVGEALEPVPNISVVGTAFVHPNHEARSQSPDAVASSQLLIADHRLTRTLRPIDATHVRQDIRLSLVWCGVPLPRPLMAMASVTSAIVRAVACCSSFRSQPNGYVERDTVIAAPPD
jgi:hypothetical protein